MPKLICIAGPTASGKTAAAVALAKRIGAEIVSADSVQVYRGMDIGSAKPTKDEMQGVPHHMIDCVPIDEPEFSVSKYASMAESCIDEIRSRNHPVIVTGGSGLYLNALTRPLNFAAPKDAKIRMKWENAYDEDPVKTFIMLKSVDAVSSARIHPNDRKRVVRALEVFEASGKRLSDYGNDFQNDRADEPKYPSVRFGLTMDRERLNERINRRVDGMMKAGLLSEARRIYDRGYPMELPAMQSIGYAQLFSAFRGEMSLEDAIEKIKLDTRRFAKRQMTWLRRDHDLIWIDVTEHCGDGDWAAEAILSKLPQDWRMD